MNNDSTNPPLQNSDVPPQVGGQTPSAPSFGLVKENNPFAPFPQVGQDPPATQSSNPPIQNQPTPQDLAGTLNISPDNSSSKFTMFIVSLSLIVVLILAGVVYLFVSNKQLATSTNSQVTTTK